LRGCVAGKPSWTIAWEQQKDGVPSTNHGNLKRSTRIL
jgi:hypothetical protein